MLESRQRQSGWRKRYFLGSDKFKERIIGKPVLVETTLHGEFLDRMPDVRDVHPGESPTMFRKYGSVTSSNNMKELPPLSFQVDSEEHLTPRPVSEVPTASSIYTRPSPEIPYEFDPDAAVAPLFSGKPRPLNDSLGGSGLETLEESDSDSSFQPTFTDRARQAGMSHLGIDTGGRGIWVGASGNTNQLTPITATPITMSVDGSISPIEEHDKSKDFQYHPSDDYPTPVSPGQQERTATPTHDQYSASHLFHETPPKVSRFSWTTRATPENEGLKTVGHTTPETLSSWNSSPPPYPQRGDVYQQSPTPAGRARNMPMSRHHHLKALSAGNPLTPESSPLVANGQAWQPQPAASTSSQQPNVQITTTPPSPIMSRSRPLAVPKAKAAAAPSVTSANNQKTMRIKRKPTPNGAPLSPASTVSLDGEHSAEAGDKHKSLPVTPSTLESVDHITLLQSQLSTLRVRKHNLLKVIASHTALFAAEKSHPGTLFNPVIVDMAHRREVKAKVEILERDLAEVIREEHDIGLRVMRAQRRRDQEAPSALWVRRVTRVSDAS